MIPVFLSAPLRPVEGETKESNLARARFYYKALSLALPGYAFIAPWILNCEVFPETPEMIGLGMKRNFFWIDRCHEVWWCGPRVSSGMKEEGGRMRAGDGGIVRAVYVDEQHGFVGARNIDSAYDIVEIGPAHLLDYGYTDMRPIGCRPECRFYNKTVHDHDY